MTTYQLDFEKIKIESSSESPIFSGINFNENITNIFESTEDEYTQFIFMLHESFYENKKFKGWLTFSKDYLKNLIKNDEYVYRENFINGNNFVNGLYLKIDNFLNNYCKIVEEPNNIENNYLKKIINLSIKQREQLNIFYLSN